MAKSKAQEPPIPGRPTVEWLDEAKSLARWTFASPYVAIQWYEFNHWIGWYGFEEWDMPERILGRTWIVRKGSPTAARDREYAKAVEALTARMNDPEVEAMLAFFRKQQQ